MGIVDKLLEPFAGINKVNAAPRNPLADFPSFSMFAKEQEAVAWVRATHPARKDTLPLPPSFRYHMDALIRSFQREQTLAGQRPFSVLASDRGWVQAQMRALKIPTADVLRESFQLQRLREALDGISRCVVKPLRAHSSRGVISLQRQDDFDFYCLQKRRSLRMVEILDRLYTDMREYRFANEWQVEELLLPPSGQLVPLDDFKFYAFRGRVGLILQVARTAGGNKYRWYDRDWRAVRTGKYDDEVDETLLLPREPHEMLRIAELVSAKLTPPFCRVDLYETSRGVVLGELTPEPGTYHAFGDMADLYLGALFELAGGVSVDANRLG